jgi:hypothetical protein
MVSRRLLLALLTAFGPAAAQKIYTYVGRLGTDRALLAWGTTEGAGNTIGRDSTPLGRAEVHLAGRTLETPRNWIEIDGLEPDRSYEYEVRINGRSAGRGTFRTLPLRATRLAFLVIGDYGNGSRGQYEIAGAMWRAFLDRQSSPNPIRFVLTTGDNIYAEWLPFRIRSGSRDRDWERKFFAPYEPLLRHIPFYPTLGNHDGNESESRADLAVYLDNFFFPGAAGPARYYRFNVGDLADFFALDTTSNTPAGPPSAAYREGGEQHRWLERVLAQSRAPWKIPYFHHPPFNAGPGHPASLGTLRHFTRLFEQHGVTVAFSGHEHNFQMSACDARTGGICYVVTGAGGELRASDVTSRMQAASIAAWAPQRHFLLVEIEGGRMRIYPLASDPVTVFDPFRRPVKTPLEVRLPEAKRPASRRTAARSAPASPCPVGCGPPARRRARG